MTEDQPTGAGIDTERWAHLGVEREHAAVLAAMSSERLRQMDIKLDTIQTQTIKTNGRVDHLESWRDKIVGAWLTVSILGPVITGLIVGFLLKSG